METILTKEMAETHAANIIWNVENGRDNPLEAYISIARLEKALAEAKAAIKEDAMKEFDKHGSKTIEIFGATITKKEGGTKFDYSNCNDAELFDLDGKTKKFAEDLKTRQKFLQAIPEGKEVFDGDGIQIFPPTKSSTTVIAVTLK